MIFLNNLKTDLENDNEKVVPSIPSPEPAISCFDDLDFFKDFKNEFPAIAYNDAQTSKSDLLIEPILNPQHIDEFNLKDETSLSEYDEKEQNVLYFNDLFPFNVIHPDDLKSEKDNDNNEVDTVQSLVDMALLPREQRYLSVQHLRNLTTFSKWIQIYLQRILYDSKPMKITRKIVSMNGTRTWKDDGYCNGGNLPGAYIIGNQLHYQDYERYEALENCKLNDKALKNKAIMEGSIKEDDDESR
ncbi:hypothetical protein Tco_0905465 [Tanacetum coccineum]